MASGVSFVGLEIDRQARVALKNLGGTLAKGRKQLLEEIARFWHKEIFPSHFTPGAESRYGYEPRSKGYREGKKLRYGRGQGKYVSNVFTGMSKRWMTTSDDFRGTGNTMTVHMKAPDYFRKPFVGTRTFPSGKSFTIKRQPDKVSEVTRTNPADMQRIRKFASTRLQQLVNQGIKASKAA